MPPAVLGLLVAAAILHAGWNILLKTASDPLRTAGRGMLVGAIVLLPVGAVGWLAVGRPAIPTEAWLLAIGSGVLEAIYFGLLSGAYSRGDLSLVYPIARGTAPVIAVFVGIVFLGERLGVQGTIGVALLLAGILVAPAAVGRPPRLGHDVPPDARGGLAGGRDRGRHRLLLGGRPDRRPAHPAVALRDADLDLHRGLPASAGSPWSTADAARRPSWPWPRSPRSPRPTRSTRRRTRRPTRRPDPADPGPPARAVRLGTSRGRRARDRRRLPARPGRLRVRPADGGRAGPRVGHRPRSPAGARSGSARRPHVGPPWRRLAAGGRHRRRRVPARDRGLTTDPSRAARSRRTPAPGQALGGPSAGTVTWAGEGA